MKIENMVNVVFTEREVAKALLDSMMASANSMHPLGNADMVNKLYAIVENGNKNLDTCAVEFDDEHFTLMIDGVAFVDDVPEPEEEVESEDGHGACFGTCQGECKHR